MKTSVNLLLFEKMEVGGNIPPIGSSFMITESGKRMITESGKNMVTEEKATAKILKRVYYESKKNK